MLTDLQQGYGESSFVTDCGSPSIYEEPIKCDGCTMCCALFCCFNLVYYRCLVCLSVVLFSSGNKDEQCFPYEKPLLLQIQAPGFHSYGSFSWVLLLITVGLCCILAVASYMKSYMTWTYLYYILPGLQYVYSRVTYRYITCDRGLVTQN